MDVIAENGALLAKQAKNINSSCLSTERKLTRLTYVGYGYGLSAFASSLTDDHTLKDKVSTYNIKLMNEYIEKGLFYLDNAYRYYESTSNYSKYEIGSKKYEESVDFMKWATSKDQYEHTFPRFIQYQRGTQMSLKVWLDTVIGNKVTPSAIDSLYDVFLNIDTKYMKMNTIKDDVLLYWVCQNYSTKKGVEICEL